MRSIARFLREHGPRDALRRAAGRAVTWRSSPPGAELSPPSAPRTRSGTALVVGLLAIVLWQSTFFRHRYPDISLRSSDYVLKASGGLLGWQQEFVYFLYYLNLFPVAVTEEPQEFSREGAQRLLETQGPTLVMERYWTIRYGDRLKTYLFLPQAYLTGSAADPRVMSTANGAAWVLALLALYFAFWNAGYALLGAVLVVLLGSNPFQVSEVYGRNNVFSWVITTGVLMLALHVPVLRDRRPSALYIGLVPVVAGLLLGTIRHIRTEPVVVAVSVALAYLTASALRPRTRALMVGMLAVSFWASSAGWTAYFDAKFREAYAKVKAVGGHPYDGPQHVYHMVWHALWCGLGDFDTRYGYEWSDAKGMAYALPIMKARGFVAEGYPMIEPARYSSLTLEVYWDRARKYPRTPFEVPEYTDVIREKVVHDITHDPGWYVTILGKRIWRILTTATPPSLAPTGSRQASLPASPVWGFLPLAVAPFLVRARHRLLLKTLVFLAPLASTALVVYSGEGTVYYSVMHLVAFGIVVAWGLQALLGWLSPRIVVGMVWGGRLHVIPRNPQALMQPRADSGPPVGSSCPLCGGVAPPWFAKAGRTIARCGSCRVVFVPEGLARTPSGATIYESDTPVFLADGNDEYYLDDESNLASAREKVAWMRGFVGGGRLLDVGSGFGHFLEAASGHYSASGLELGPLAVERARAHFGVSCDVGSVYAIPEALAASCDAVTAWDFIEHVPDPIGALKAMRGALRPGGHVFLSTPDARSLAARGLGRHWHYLDPVQHIVLFGRETLGRALERAGFEPVAWRSFGHHYRLRYVFDRLRYLHRGPLRWGASLGRALPAPILDRPIYIRLGDVLGVAARRLD